MLAVINAFSQHLSLELEPIKGYVLKLL